MVSDLLDTSDFEALAHLDRAHELRGLKQGFVGARVEPGTAAPKPQHG